MAVVVGIDGTGSAFIPGSGRDREYDISFANSFVRRICNTAGSRGRYFRGPVALGGGLPEAIDGGFQFIMQRRGYRTPASPSAFLADGLGLSRTGSMASAAAAGGEDIVLTGYSRGAAGVVALAKRLKDVNVPVRALLLFDCVDRHVAIDADVIPNNVGNVMHVIRDPRSGSRESFDNDGMRFTAPTVFPAAYSFMCTHGGMGGCPWTAPVGTTTTSFIDEGGVDGLTTITYLQDAQVSQQVWAHVQPFLR
ncbi:MAG: hypothetical protein PSX80_09485, partial [bacterium]|nr:hypothetical protein [bacterium]